MRKIAVTPLTQLKTASPGPAPQLQWLPINQLVVDDSYQRELKTGNWKTIRKIAANFLWSRFSPVFVAPVEGGDYAIIDGQHRTHAAALAGIEQVPCQVVHMTREEQAAAFAAVNGMVTRVTNWQIYKAALAANEGWATTLAKVAADAGCRLMTGNASHSFKKPGQIYGVTTFRKMLEKQSAERITAALAFILTVEGLGTENECWDTSILAPVVMALCQRPHVLARPDAKAKLEMFDVFALAEEIVKNNRERIRRGLPYIKKTDALEQRLIDWLDAKMPERAVSPGHSGRLLQTGEKAT